jgi:hypothetical protein
LLTDSVVFQGANRSFMICTLFLCLMTGAEPLKIARYIQHLRAICWMGHRMVDMERLCTQLPASPGWQLPIQLSVAQWKEQLEAELPLWVPLEKSLASIVCSTRHSGRGYIAISLRHLPQAPPPGLLVFRRYSSVGEQVPCHIYWNFVGLRHLLRFPFHTCPPYRNLRM